MAALGREGLKQVVEFIPVLDFGQITNILSDLGIDDLLQVFFLDKHLRGKHDPGIPSLKGEFQV
jgi:hypothetical protein